MTEDDKVEETTDVKQYDMTISGLVTAIEDFVDDEHEKELEMISNDVAVEEEERLEDECVESIIPVNDALGTIENGEVEERKEEEIAVEKESKKEKKKNKKKNKGNVQVHKTYCNL